MRRQALCDLANVPLETFKNWTRPDRSNLLPFEAREGVRSREFTETEALMLAAAYEAGRGAPSQAQVAAALKRCWQHVAKRGPEIGAGAPEIFAAIITAQDAQARECVGLVVGSIEEVAAAFTSLPKALKFGSAEYTKRFYLLRNCFFYEQGGGPGAGALEPTGVAFTNLSRALRRIVKRAAENEIDLPNGFMRQFGIKDAE